MTPEREKFASSFQRSWCQVIRYDIRCQIGLNEKIILYHQTANSDSSAPCQLILSQNSKPGLTVDFYSQFTVTDCVKLATVILQ